jgi:uridine phosphorylase
LPDADRRLAIPDSERQYHIDAARGDIAEYILLPGDQDRTAKVAALFDTVEYENRHREFATATGMYQGRRISCVSTGIGTDNVEIVIAEILAITDHPTFIRIGSSGVLKEEIEIGDLIVTTGAVRLEGTTKFYVDDGYPAAADYQAVSALVEAAYMLGYRAHLGITATSPSFYGGQGRPIPQLPIRYPNLADEMARQGVSNFEMEASAVLVLAGLAGCRAGVVCTAYAQRFKGVFADEEQRKQGEKACIETGLEALRLLAEMDEAVQKSDSVHWRPSLWSPNMAS